MAFASPAGRAAKNLTPGPSPKAEGGFATPLLLLLSKNRLSHFLNHACGVTEPKEAAYAVTSIEPKI